MTHSLTIETIDLILNLISAILDLLAIFICSTLISIIIYRIIRFKPNRRIIRQDIPLIISINILVLIFNKSFMQIAHVTYPTLLHDFNKTTETYQNPSHQFRAYALWCFTGVLYWSYVHLAFFSLLRVIYPTKIRLHSVVIHVYILIPCQYIFVSAYTLPLLIRLQSFRLVPHEVYVGVLTSSIFSCVYITMLNVILPINTMCNYYILIVRKMRRSTTTTIRQNFEIHRRDIIVIRRMSINVFILSLVSTPFIILYIIDIIQNDFHPTTYRVQWLSSSTGSFLFSFILPFVSKRLRDFLKRNQLTPDNNLNMT